MHIHRPTPKAQPGFIVSKLGLLPQTYAVGLFPEAVSVALFNNELSIKVQ